ncbi:MAG: ATP-binding protein [Dongiaceae bacterium]
MPFDPFFTTKPVSKGSGLGLTISNDLLQRMNGSIALERGLAGACFTIQLTRAASAPQGIPK